MRQHFDWNFISIVRKKSVFFSWAVRFARFKLVIGKSVRWTCYGQWNANINIWWKTRKWWDIWVVPTTEYDGLTSVQSLFRKYIFVSGYVFSHVMVKSETISLIIYYGLHLVYVPDGRETATSRFPGRYLRRFQFHCDQKTTPNHCKYSINNWIRILIPNVLSQRPTMSCNEKLWDLITALGIHCTNTCHIYTATSGAHDLNRFWWIAFLIHLYTTHQNVLEIKSVRTQKHLESAQSGRGNYCVQARCMYFLFGLTFAHGFGGASKLVQCHLYYQYKKLMGRQTK